MGQLLRGTAFTKEALVAFYDKVVADTRELKVWFDERRFTQGPKEIGFELEFSILDQSFHPECGNLKFIQTLCCDAVVPEICQLCLEINSTPCHLDKESLSFSRKNLASYWKICEDHATKRGLYLVQVGTLPTLMLEDCGEQLITKLDRFELMDKLLKSYRNFTPYHLNISGKDTLDLYRDNYCLMGATSAFQVHLKVGLDESVRYYNAALILAGPLLAIASNSPFLLQKELWEETRIPLFEQSLTFEKNYPRSSRVSLGNHYVKNSFFELFEENLFFDPLVLCDTSSEKVEPLFYLRAHNGGIHRWLRPVIDVTNRDAPHLRIENRVMPAGPTMDDMMANAALFLGAVEIFANQEIPPEELIDFYHMQENFYLAAKHGLDTHLNWFGHQRHTARELITAVILPAAHQGLKTLGIRQSDIHYYLSIIESRIKTNMTGSRWQRKFIEKYKHDFDALMESYVEQQYAGEPVHRWRL